MKATFRDINKPTKFTLSHRKEKHFCKQITAVIINEDGCAYDGVTLRIYGTDARTYACIWADSNCSWKNARYIWRNGSGSAGGYGYHRASAAAEEAIINAGIELNEHIGGRGDVAMSEAVEAIAEALWEGENVKIYITQAHA